MREAAIQPKPEVNKESKLGKILTTTKSPILNEEVHADNNVVSASTYSYSPEYNESYYAENDERIMKALTNMTDNVMKASSYFRLTGRVLEQILSNSDMLMSSQTELIRRVDGLQAARHIGIQGSRLSQ